jgi:hypothetical protein
MIDYTRKHLGFYEVNGVNYRNKIQALENCKAGHWPKFNFNDDVFSKFNWKQEPTQDILSIYKKRALQLRKKYDRLILLFSGGIDSLTALRVFVDNDIKLDGIVTYASTELYDWKSLKRNAEVVKAAVPYIRELEKEKNIKLPFYLMNDWYMFSSYTDDNWVYSNNGTNHSPETWIYNYHYKDRFIQNIMSQGKTAIIRGVDKPRILYDDLKDQWYISFLDKQCGHFSTANFEDNLNKWYEIEYFFWARDCPELLCKQAHLIKKFFEKLNIKQDKNKMDVLFSKDKGKFSTKEYYKWVDGILYPGYCTHAPGQDKNYFSLPKTNIANAMPKDIVFFDKADQKNVEVWRAGIKKIIDNVDRSFMDGVENNKDYTIDNYIKHGTTGIWSMPHYLN